MGYHADRRTRVVTSETPIPLPGWIVGVVEALLLQCPFQIPVDFGHEEEPGNA